MASYLDLNDFKKLLNVSKRIKDFICGNVEFIKILNSLYHSKAKSLKHKTKSLKDKLNNVEEELARKKKVLYLDYDEAKDSIREYLPDFINDHYVPGKKIKDSIDKS